MECRSFEFLTRYCVEFESISNSDGASLLASKIALELDGEPEEVAIVEFLDATQIPDDFRLQESTAFVFPDWECVQTIYRRIDQTAVLIIEGAGGLAWYRNRAHIHLSVGETSCQLIELEQSVAVSLDLGCRTITVFGLERMEDITRWVTSLSQCSAANVQEPLPTRILIQNRLNQHGAHAHYFRRIEFEYSNRTLTLLGRLPTFYLKQVLQTVLRDIHGVERIINLVEVDE